MNRPWLPIIGTLTVIGALLGGGIFSVTQPPPVEPGPGIANLWVDTNGGTCSRSVALVSYVDAAACASVSAAYGAASGGDKILVRCGTYGTQAVNQRSIGTSPVSIEAEDWSTETRTWMSGTRPTCVKIDGNVTITSPYVNFRGFDLWNGIPEEAIDDTRGRMSTGAGGDSTQVHHVNVEDIDFRTSREIIGQDIAYRRVRAGNYNLCASGSGADEDVFRVWPDTNGPPYDESQRITIADSLIGNVVVTGGNYLCGADYHADCIQFLAGEQMVVSGNTFTGCVTSDVIQRPFQNGHLDATLMQNNFFGSVQFFGATLNIGAGGDDCGGPNYILRFNVIQGSSQFACNELGAMQIYGNIYVISGFVGCGTGNNWSTNVFTAATNTCGSNVYQCVPTWLVPGNANSNFHLSGSDTCARSRGGTAPTQPSTDIDSEARPQGANYDIGADEIP